MGGLIHRSVPTLSVSPQTPLVWRAVTSWSLLKIVTSWCRKSLLLLVCMMHREARAGTTLAIVLRGPNDGVHFNHPERTPQSMGILRFWGGAGVGPSATAIAAKPRRRRSTCFAWRECPRPTRSHARSGHTENSAPAPYPASARTQPKRTPVARTRSISSSAMRHFGR